jgi:hypothetical protein
MPVCSIYFNPGNSVYIPVDAGGPSPFPLSWYYGIGTSPATFDTVSLTPFSGDGVWIGEKYTETLYYISALYSNVTTGEKGLAVSNPQGVYAIDNS